MKETIYSVEELLKLDCSYILNMLDEMDFSFKNGVYLKELGYKIYHVHVNIFHGGIWDQLIYAKPEETIEAIESLKEIGEYKKAEVLSKTISVVGENIFASEKLYEKKINDLEDDLEQELEKKLEDLSQEWKSTELFLTEAYKAYIERTKENYI